MTQSNKNDAARRLFLGSKVWTLVKTDVDSNHKAKDKDCRIEVKATMFMPRGIEVNELKSTTGAGGKQIIVVNGGANEIRIPHNYQLIDEVRKFKSEENTETNPSYFDVLNAAVGVANAHNEGEIIRLTLIIDDAIAQRNCIKEAVKANNDAVAACKEDLED